MTLRAGSIRLAVALLAAVAMPAQALPTSGQYFQLQGASGKYLYATGESEKLGMANISWNDSQWQYIDQGSGYSVLQSVHGTVMGVLVNSSQPVQVPDYSPTNNPTIEVVNVRFSTSKGFAADEVVLFVYVNSAFTAKVIVDNNGTLGMADVSGSVTQPNFALPAGAKWKVIPQANALGVRLPIKKGAKNLQMVRLESMLAGAGYFLVEENIEINVQTFMSHLWINKPPYPSPRFSPNLKITRIVSLASPAPYPEPLHFGETVYLLFPHSDPYGVRPSTSDKNNFTGRWLAEAGRMDNSNMSRHQWKLLDLTGKYKTGDRVPMGVQVAFTNVATGQNLGAYQGLSRAEMVSTPGMDAQWKILPPE